MGFISSAVKGIIAIGFILGMVVLIQHYFELNQLRSIIKDCNKSYGEGQWTFVETKDAFICRKYDSSQSRICTTNGVLSECN